jgi:hypothetical protein
MHVEAVYGHAQMARRSFARALGSAVTDGVCDEDTAVGVARAALHDNPAALYGVQT